jgi:predicted aspartyl protease
VVSAGDPSADLGTIHALPSIKLPGIWDTGATGCVISKEAAQQLNLQPIGMTKVNHADGESVVNKYLVNIGLPNGVIFPRVVVTEGRLFTNAMLIGMNIISQGDFAVTNHNGCSMFSFRLPSMEAIDFIVQQPRIEKPKPTHTPARNKPCPCGSKRKYKYCCGKDRG